MLAISPGGSPESTRPPRLTILREHRGRLAARADELNRLVAYLDAKIEWVREGSPGAPPAMSAFLAPGEGSASVGGT